MTAFACTVHSPGMDTSLIARGGTPIELDRTRILFFDKTAYWLLQVKYGAGPAAALYTAKPVGKDGYRAELKDIDALELFLLAGLQADAQRNGETLTREQVGEWLMPSTIPMIFEAVVRAFTRGIHTPPAPGDAGKADAAAARPAAVAKKPASQKRSTSQKRSGSRSRSSARLRSSSGRRR